MKVSPTCFCIIGSHSDALMLSPKHLAYLTPFYIKITLSSENGKMCIENNDGLYYFFSTLSNYLITPDTVLDLFVGILSSILFTLIDMFLFRKKSSTLSIFLTHPPFQHLQHHIYQKSLSKGLLRSLSSGSLSLIGSFS